MLLAAGWVSAAAQDMPSVIAHRRGWGDTRESRRAQAAEWLGEVSKIDRQIPTLSPVEEAWLKVEYDEEVAREGLTPRAMRALNSRDGLARFTKPATKSLVSVLEQLAANAKLNQQAEVALWGRLAYLALDQNLWANIASLGDLGVLARDPKSKIGTGGIPDYDVGLRFIWASRAQYILGEIVLPTLESAQR